MSSSSTLVNVAEDAEIRLVRLLAQTAKSGSFVQDCEACISNGDAANLLQTIARDGGALQALFALPQADEADEAVSAFSILTALLSRVNPSQAPGLTKMFADSVSNMDGASPERKIQLLSVLYNMRSNGSEKCALLARMISLAPPELLQTGVLGDILQEDLPPQGVAPSCPRIVALLDTWQVPVQDRRELYLAAARGMSASRKQRFLLLFVDSYKAGTPIDDQGLAVAQEAALGAIKDPVSLFAHQRNMLSMPAIQALPANLNGLLKVFQEGKLEDYQAFLQNNGGPSQVLQPLGLSPDECIRQMRILSLCSLSSEHEEIPYSVVAKTLQLNSETEVESWVIAAVSSGLLSAKMDQLQQKVMVERCVVRKFDTEQWRLLQSRLKSWKQNVGGVLQGLKQSNAGSAAAAAGQ